MWVRVFMARPGIRYRCARLAKKGPMGRWGDRWPRPRCVIWATTAEMAY